jgi:tetratricopeptide (TPR) repeat protein
MQEPTTATARPPARGPSLRRLIWWMIWFSLTGWLLIRLPSEVSYWMLALAEKASVEGRTDEALAWVERAKQWTPKSTLPRRVMALALQKAGKLDELGRIDLVLQGDDLSPKEKAELHLEKSEIFQRKRRWDDAIAEFDEAANFKGELRPSKERFELLMLAGREDEARREVDQMLAASSTDAQRAQVHLFKCDFHQMRSEWAEALEEFDAAAALQPTLRPSTARLKLLMLAGQDDEAGHEAEQLLEADTSDPEKAKVHLALSAIHRKRGSWNDALREFDEAVQLNSQLSPAPERLELLLLANKQDEAREELAKIERKLASGWWQSPATIDNTVAYFGALLGDDLDRALTRAEKAADARPNDPAILDTRAYILYRLNRHEDALTDANSAIDLMDEIFQKQPIAEIRKSVAVLYYHRSLILEALGKSSEAERDRTRVRELGFEPDEHLF